MKVALLTNIVSPHQLPLAEEIVKLVGAENYCYAYTEPFHEERAKMGWGDGSAPEWCKPVNECRNFLETADLVYCEERDVELFEKRLKAGKKTFYVSERWFKPILLPCGISLPGWLKLLHPRYRKMAVRFAHFFRHEGFIYLPQGIHAVRDMARLCGLMHGDWRCLFRAPRLEFERKPGGRVFLTQRHRGTEIDAAEAKKYCLDKMRMWGYFVERGDGVRGDGVTDLNGCHSPTHPPTHSRTLRVLWVGRMIEWKRVDTIVKATSWIHANVPNVKIALTLVGNGDKRGKVEELAKGDAGINIIDSIPIAEVRNLMRRHNVYVLASNAEEGWGAALNEALEEGMLAFGTSEAGASAAILPKTHLFHAGDWRALSRLLLKAANGEIKPIGIGDWTAKVAAKRLLEFAE